MTTPGSAAKLVSPEGAAPSPHSSSMRPRLGAVHWVLSRYAFAHVHVDAKMVERVRRLAERGSVVCVMRNRSIADYLLIRSVLLREGLPLPEFANDLAIGWFRPLAWILARIVERLSRLQVFGHGKRQRVADRETAQQLVRAGAPVLLFLRAQATGLLGLFRRGRAIHSQRIGDPYLEDVLSIAGERPVFIVPLAPFRGRGYRKRSSRLATLVYSVREAPNELKKLLTVLFNRHDLSLTIGEEIDLRTFLQRYGAKGPAGMVRRLTRALTLFLYREERVVWGPPLLPKLVVRDLVLGQRSVREAMEGIAAARKRPVDECRREAARYFDEIASNFNGTYFAILAFFFRRIWNRIFRGVEITGLDRVADCIRRHPVVLVPCHRSHFDYLILSYIFHAQFLSPPHIAAGMNLSFFPMVMLFRGAGAFFIRRSFGDNELYKVVFREYLAYLIREGYTQEFFIEGGRSRTGKILTPKLGMLSAIVNAFLHGARRDLYFVPVSISYERLVEEEAYKRELEGADKPKENLLALVRARSVLRANYGTAFVDFAEPISLAQALGSLGDRFRERPDDLAIEEETRRFNMKLGFRLLAEVNAASKLSAPSVAATVLLSNPFPAIRVGEFLRAARLLLDHAERLGACFTGSLEKDRETFQETLAFLQTSGLVARLEDGDGGDGGILHVPDDKRINLDFYKNNSIHLYVMLSLVSHALERGVARDALDDEIWWWRELFRNEFVLPERDGIGRRVDVLLECMRGVGMTAEGAVDFSSPIVRASAAVLQNFREAYWIAARALRDLGAEGKTEKALVAEMQKAYRASLLLGVCRKPEGNTTVTLQNAINRLEEMGHVRSEGRGRGVRCVLPGAAHAALAELENRLARSVTAPALGG